MATDLDRRISLILQTGKLALETGADSQRVHALLQQLAGLLGLDELHLLFSFRALGATASMDDSTITSVTAIGSMGVNMRTESALGKYIHGLEVCPGLDELERELAAIAGQPSGYQRWLVLLLVGAACAAFSHLFGGDEQTALRVCFGASAGMWLKFFLTARRGNPVLVSTVCAAVSALLATAPVPGVPEARDIGILTTASVLYLVPGVPMINALEDLLQGHMNMAIGRGVAAAVLLTSIAIGLIISLTIIGGLS